MWKIASVDSLSYSGQKSSHTNFQSCDFELKKLKAFKNLKQLLGFDFIKTAV